MIIRLVSPNKKWLLFNMAFMHGDFVDMFARGWAFSLNYPQRIDMHGITRFRGINIRRITKIYLERDINK